MKSDGLSEAAESGVITSVLARLKFPRPALELMFLIFGGVTSGEDEGTNITEKESFPQNGQEHLALDDFNWTKQSVQTFCLQQATEFRHSKVKKQIGHSLSLISCP
mmetsp:Transcript_28142/g.38686  ORF Transcript_28142/g.38686 Transcript_28142/m.38686 type:complete len:106 (-) Transcript_28142:217-534(-)